MILSDHAIKEEIASRNLVIDPLDETDIQPASVDIHIDNRGIYADPTKTLVLDLRRKVEDWIEVDITGEDFLIRPGMLLLVGTRERFSLGSNIAGVVHGKSSLARHGLSIQSGAPWVDPGFEGHLTLKIGVSSDIPVLLYPDMKIGQIVFHYVDRPVMNLYSATRGSKYNGSKGPTPNIILDMVTEIPT